jgi:hypothetical protein
MMMRQLFVLLFIIFPTLQNKAELTPTSVSEMAEKAELIFHGKITKVLNKKMEVSIIQNIKGECKEKKITVEKFMDWMCASRYKAYKVGQQELFFLQTNRKNNTWKIMGGGDEGEIPIINNTLYFKSAFSACCQLTGVGVHKLNHGEKMYGYAFDLKEAAKGISLYLQQEKEIKKKLLDLSILDYYPKNKFFLQIINEMICDISRGFTEEEITNRKFDL